MASSQQPKSNSVKYRPREEQVYQQFLQADLEVQTIDWKNEKVTMIFSIGRIFPQLERFSCPLRESLANFILYSKFSITRTIT